MRVPWSTLPLVDGCRWHILLIEEPQQQKNGAMGAVGGGEIYFCLLCPLCCRPGVEMVSHAGRTSHHARTLFFSYHAATDKIGQNHKSRITWCVARRVVFLAALLCTPYMLLAVSIRRPCLYWQQCGRATPQSRLELVVVLHTIGILGCSLLPDPRNCC